MRAALIHSITAIKAVNTKFGPKVVAEIQIKDEAKREFWMSPKQGQKLEDCFSALQEHGGYSTKRAECHVILDAGERGERFVWCGMHTPRRSELAFLEDKFGVEIDSPYIGRFDQEVSAVDSQLRDE